MYREMAEKQRVEFLKCFERAFKNQGAVFSEGREVTDTARKEALRNKRFIH